jgi:hypothetical protein
LADLSHFTLLLMQGTPSLAQWHYVPRSLALHYISTFRATSQAPLECEPASAARSSQRRGNAVPFPVPFPLLPHSHLGHGCLSPLVCWPLGTKSHRIAKCYRAIIAPVSSTAAFGVGCREKTDPGSAGGRVHMPSSSHHVSLLFRFGSASFRVRLGRTQLS